MSNPPLRRATPDLPATPIQQGESKQEWVYRQLTEGIRRGLLPPGSTIPSTRLLAARWQVSRGIVELAFEQLQREGYTTAVQGQRTAVSASLPEDFLHSRRLAVDTNWLFSAHAATADDEIEGVDFQASLLSGVRTGQAFVARLPDSKQFDVEAWRKCVKLAANRFNHLNMMDSDPKGLLTLREHICTHLAASRGIRCHSDDVIVVTGIRHAIDLCAQIVSSSSMDVALEDPGYAGAERIFALRGCRTAHVPVDEEGLDTGRLDELPRGSLAYVTPAHQAPLGVTMSVARRAALLQWARRTNAWILEDDYDSDFNYESAPLPALKSMDADDRVIFCGSFNKALFPALRIGYIVVPKALAAQFSLVRAATGRSNSILDQLTLVEFMASGSFWQHLKQARKSYQTRRDLVMDTLSTASGRELVFKGIHAGFHFLLELPEGKYESALVEAADQQGIRLQGLRSFYRLASCRTEAVLIGYTALADLEARSAAQRLGMLLS